MALFYWLTSIGSIKIRTNTEFAAVSHFTDLCNVQRGDFAWLMWSWCQRSAVHQQTPQFHIKTPPPKKNLIHGGITWAVPGQTCSLQFSVNVPVSLSLWHVRDTISRWCTSDARKQGLKQTYLYCFVFMPIL